MAMVAVATILAFLAINALWLNRQFLNTDNWTKTSSQLLQSKAVRTQISAFLVDQLYANVNVQGVIQQALPPQAKALAGPAAGGLRNLAGQGVDTLLQRPRVQLVWEQANRAAHQQLLAVLNGGNHNVSTNGGTVTLNLGAVLSQVATNLGLGNVAAKIPPNAAQITILRSDQLSTVQNLFQAFKDLVIVLLVLALGLFAGAVAVAKDRRARLRAVGIGFVVAGIGALLARALLGQEVVDSLSSTAAVKPAVEDVWSTATSQLVIAATASIAYGVLLFVGAWLAGRTRPATATRRRLAPYLRNPRIADGVLFAVIVLVIAWGPLPATRNPLSMLVLAALLALGVEVLRRQVEREFPAATIEAASERRQDRVKRLRWPAAAQAPDADPAPPSEGRFARLEQLGKLRDDGVLDDDEFTREKELVLNGSSS
jgi:hypothetical protein